jgi:hypothetical protein
VNERLRAYILRGDSLQANANRLTGCQ